MIIDLQKTIFYVILQIVDYFKGEWPMYPFIKPLVDFFLISPFHKIWLVLIFWLFWPGLIFIVGIVGESRLIPIGQHQSQAFLPGDLSLGIMAVALLSLHANKLEKPNYWGYSPIWWLVVLITVSFIAYYARKNDVANYPYRSSISPTKITHDIVGYWLIPTLLIALGIPKLFSNFVHSTLFIDWTSWVTFIGAIAFYIACVIQDYVIGYTTEDVLARHPENWQPIWKR